MSGAAWSCRRLPDEEGQSRNHRDDDCLRVVVRVVVVLVFIRTSPSVQIFPLQDTSAMIARRTALPNNDDGATNPSMDKGQTTDNHPRRQRDSSYCTCSFQGTKLDRHRLQSRTCLDLSFNTNLHQLQVSQTEPLFVITFPQKPSACLVERTTTPGTALLKCEDPSNGKGDWQRVLALAWTILARFLQSLFDVGRWT